MSYTIYIELSFTLTDSRPSGWNRADRLTISDDWNSYTYGEVLDPTEEPEFRDGELFGWDYWRAEIAAVHTSAPSDFAYGLRHPVFDGYGAVSAGGYKYYVATVESLDEVDPALLRNGFLSVDGDEAELNLNSWFDNRSASLQAGDLTYAYDGVLGGYIDNWKGTIVHDNVAPILDAVNRVESVRTLLTEYNTRLTDVIETGVRGLGNMSDEEIEAYNESSLDLMREAHAAYQQEFRNQVQAAVEQTGAGFSSVLLRGADAFNVSVSLGDGPAIAKFSMAPNGVTLSSPAGDFSIVGTDGVYNTGSDGGDRVVALGEPGSRQNFLLRGGDDIFLGSDSEEVIRGEAGNDWLFGNGGNDLFYGGSGSNVVFGGDGVDAAKVSGFNGAGSGLIRYGDAVFHLDRASQTYDVFREVERFDDSDSWNLTGSKAIAFETVHAFDPKNYAASHNDLARTFGASPDAALSHYLQYGFSEGRETSFDPVQYVVNHADLQAAFGTNYDAARDHFLNNGVSEGRLANDPLDYIASYDDLRSAFSGRSEGELKGLGLWHYSVAGYGEERRDGIDFNPWQYLANYDDLRAVFGTNDNAAAVHFINNGFAEGRLAEDPLDYLASFSDLIDTFSGRSPDQLRQAALDHYTAAGFAEGRGAGIDFDADQYLANYDDLRLAFADGHGGYDENAATLHFIQSGYLEGRIDDPMMA